ncbi:MAG: hypothetical protein KDC98_01855, partial [Planctomycetes bacterium]|nr:hypothetical protein [Planctomycetota bacterium]
MSSGAGRGAAQSGARAVATLRASVSAFALAVTVAGAQQRTTPVRIEAHHAPATLLVLGSSVADETGLRRVPLVAFTVAPRQPDGSFARRIILEKNLGFFGAFGEHRLVADRYLVAPSASIVDIFGGEVLNAVTAGRVLEVTGTRVVYRTEAADVVPFGAVFSFDIASQQRQRLDAADLWYRPGVRSPDGEHVVEARVDGELWLHGIGVEPKRLAEGMFATLGAYASGVSPGAPLRWLDADTVLTQRDNGVLVTVSLAGDIEELLRIPDIGEAGAQPTFAVDADS